MADTKKNKSEENLTEVSFNFYSLKFTPYNDRSDLTSSIILNQVITYVSNELLNGKGHLIDRHLNRDGKKNPRELFITRAVILAKEKRIRCSMALLRAGRVPKLKPADKFKLIQLDKTQGQIAEETHFFIDYSKSSIVLCVEYNYHGPRISDIEYYFRNVAKDTLRIAKATDLELYMDIPIEKALADLKNVLNIDIKIQPQKLVQMDTDLVGQYFTALSNFGHKIKPKYIKLEAMFQTPGNSVRSSEINVEAKSMVTTLLQRFQNRKFNIDCFDNFVVRYEDKEGKEEVFNLLKGKKEIIKLN